VHKPPYEDDIASERKTCAKRRENVFAQLESIIVTRGASTIKCFFDGANAPREISRFSVSRSQGIEKSWNFALGQVASVFSQANCFGSISRLRIGIRREQPREFVQHLWRVRCVCSDVAQSLQPIRFLR
jgi:hypothetical protein